MENLEDWVFNYLMSCKDFTKSIKINELIKDINDHFNHFDINYDFGTIMQVLGQISAEGIIHYEVDNPADDFTIFIKI